MTPQKSIKEIVSAEEISLIDLFLVIKPHLKYVYYSVGIFFVIGIIHTITAPKEYEAKSTILLESTNTSSSSESLRGLAGLAGINLPTYHMAAGDINADLYPAIIDSQPFLYELMKEKFYFSDEKKNMSLYEYLLKNETKNIISSTIGFIFSIPDILIGMFQTSQPIPIPPHYKKDNITTTNEKNTILKITGEEIQVMNSLRNRIKIESSKKNTRTTTFITKMRDAYVSAELNNTVRKKVVDYVINYKTEKKRANLEFVEKQLKESENKFKAAQYALASFKDSNREMIYSTTKAKEQELQAEFNLEYNIYNNLSLEFYKAKIDMEKETPIFSIFEPVTMPLSNTEPNIKKILLMYIAAGILFGGMLVPLFLFKSYYNSIREEKKLKTYTENQNIP